MASLLIIFPLLSPNFCFPVPLCSSLLLSTIVCLILASSFRLFSLSVHIIYSIFIHLCSSFSRCSLFSFLYHSSLSWASVCLLSSLLRYSPCLSSSLSYFHFNPFSMFPSLVRIALLLLDFSILSLWIIFFHSRACFFTRKLVLIASEPDGMGSCSFSICFSASILLFLEDITLSSSGVGTDL